MFPFISVISDTIAIVIDKIILKDNSITSKSFMIILFTFMWIFSLPCLYFFEITKVDFLKIFILFLIIIWSALQNYLFYFSLNNKDLNSLEPIRNSEPIVIMLLAFMIFPDERNIFILVLGLIITLALIYSQIEFKNFKKVKIIFDKYLLVLIFSIFISAILYIGYKYALEFVNPATLYSIRTLWVLFLLFILCKGKGWRLNKTQIFLSALSAFLYSLSAITQYISIARMGLNITILILSLSPIIIYSSSHFILKEDINIHQILSSIIIVFCVTIAMVVI